MPPTQRGEYAISHSRLRTSTHSIRPPMSSFIPAISFITDGRTNTLKAVATLAHARAPVYVLTGNRDSRAKLCEAFSDCGYLLPDFDFVHYAVDDYPVRLIALDTLSCRQQQG